MFKIFCWQLKTDFVVFSLNPNPWTLTPEPYIIYDLLFTNLLGTQYSKSLRIASSELRVIVAGKLVDFLKVGMEDKKILLRLKDQATVKWSVVPDVRKRIDF